MIYRLALVDSQPIILTDDHGFEEPMLLITCKDIRKEAATIFYAENTWKVDAKDYKISTYLRWLRIVRAVCKRNEVLFSVAMSQTTTYGSYNPNWTNLVEWLKAFHKGTTRRHIMKPSDARKQDGFDSTNIDLIAVGMIFETMKNMRAKKWDRIEKVLKNFRVILAMDDPRWDL